AWSFRAGPSAWPLTASNTSVSTMTGLRVRAPSAFGRRRTALLHSTIFLTAGSEREGATRIMKGTPMAKWFALASAAVAVLAFVSWRLLSGPEPPTVVVYVSHDQVFSEPIVKDFERDTGVKVRAIYDTEETKSTGAMNRLISEKNNPQADVYWANEPVRAEVLRQQGIAAPYVSPNAHGIPASFKDANGYWTGFAARARILIVNKNISTKPDSMLAYADAQWRGKTVVANPLFGTTTTQIAALFVLWGDERGQAFMN